MHLHPALHHTNQGQWWAPPELRKNPQTRSIFICFTLLKRASIALKMPLKFLLFIFMSQKAAWSDPVNFCGCVWWASMVSTCSPSLFRWTRSSPIILFNNQPNSFFKFLIKVWLIYNVMPISAVQQSDPAIYMYIFSFFIFHHGLSQEIGYSIILKWSCSYVFSLMDL